MTSTEREAIEADELLGRLILHAGKNTGKPAYSIKQSLLNIMLSQFLTKFIQNLEVHPSREKGLGWVSTVIPMQVASLTQVSKLQRKLHSKTGFSIYSC